MLMLKARETQGQASYSASHEELFWLEFEQMQLLADNRSLTEPHLQSTPIITTYVVNTHFMIVNRENSNQQVASAARTMVMSGEPRNDDSWEIPINKPPLVSHHQ